MPPVPPPPVPTSLQTSVYTISTNAPKQRRHNKLKLLKSELFSFISLPWFLRNGPQFCFQTNIRSHSIQFHRSVPFNSSIKSAVHVLAAAGQRPESGFIFELTRTLDTSHETFDSKKYQHIIKGVELLKLGSVPTIFWPDSKPNDTCNATHFTGTKQSKIPPFAGDLRA